MLAIALLVYAARHSFEIAYRLGIRVLCIAKPIWDTFHLGYCIIALIETAALILVAIVSFKINWLLLLVYVPILIIKIQHTNHAIHDFKSSIVSCLKRNQKK